MDASTADPNIIHALAQTLATVFQCLRSDLTDTLELWYPSVPSHPGLHGAPGLHV